MLSIIVAQLLVTHSASTTKPKSTPAYLDTHLSPQTRAWDLVHRMTLAEEIGQMMNEAPAIPRLHIQKYNWWSESLHGIAKPGNVTVYPQVIGLGATWDTQAVHEMADQISDEERARWNYVKKHGDQGWDQGLDSWAPNINIFRDPRWGRGQETYGEDPYLTGRMAVNYILGLQGNNPKHFKTIATPKHFDVHSGPDPLRHKFDAEVSKREAWITYLPAFQAAITEGNAWSIMGAYSAFEGVPDCANSYLLGTVLRQRWGFNGYVVSDCGAISDIAFGHHYAKNLVQACADAVKAGCDLDCGGEYVDLNVAVRQGLISKKYIDQAVERLMEARIRLGMFDPTTPYDHISMKVVDSNAHRALARKLARQSIVLLKNKDHTLPLSTHVPTIAVIGPNANNPYVLLGNYNGMNRKIITPLQGIKNAVGSSTKVLYARGCGIESASEGTVVPANCLNITGTYYANQNLSGTPAKVIHEKQINYNWADSSPFRNFPQTHFSARWTGTLNPKISGQYMIGFTCDDGMRLFINHKLVLEDWSDHAAETKTVPYTLIAGKHYHIQLDYYQSAGEAVAKFIWAPPATHPFSSALAIAKKANVIVAVMGISGAQEGEEHDRTSIGLPQVQLQLLAQLKKLGKPIVLVYINGGPISDPWSKANIPAIVEAWYPGEEGGDGLADILFGKASPSGRLPVTVVDSIKDLPPFKDYHMQDRTYRFDAKHVLYPFGYGLSYTTFKFTDFTCPSKLETGHDLVLHVTVTNTGNKTSDEVVEAYIHHDHPSLPMPDLALRAFTRVRLLPHQSKRIRLVIRARDLAVVHADTTFWDEAEPIKVWVGRGQPYFAHDRANTVQLVGHEKEQFWPKARK